MIVKTKAIVFSAIKYAEADLIVTCFTETDGVKSYLLRNILKSRRSPLKTSYFQPLSQLELVANHKHKGTLDYIRDAKILFPYKTLHTDIVKTSLVMFLSEILKNCIREEEANPQLYHFIAQSLIWLDENDDVANFHIYFMLQLSLYLGFYPDASNSSLPYFNVLEGKFQHHKTDHYCLDGETIDHFRLFFDKNPDDLKTISLSKPARANLVDLLLTYYQLHVQGYKKPKSLAVLNQLFN